MKYTYEKKLLIVSRVKQGEAIPHLSREYHLHKNKILVWVCVWYRYGREGLEKQPRTKATPEFKA